MSYRLSDVESMSIRMAIAAVMTQKYIIEALRVLLRFPDNSLDR